MMKRCCFQLTLQLTLVCSAVVLAGEPQVSRPNILWLTMEDTSFFLGCYGDKVAKTPNIDRLAKEGTLFTRAFASSPVCSPARSALITGMSVGELGIGNHRSRVQIPDSVKGYPAYLRQAGYYCTNHTKNDFNFTNAGQFAANCWDDSSRNAHWRNRPEGKPFFSIFNYADSHQSRTSVNSYQRFQRRYQSQLNAEEIASPKDVSLPPFYHDSPRMRKAFARVYDCITLVDKQIGQRLQQLDADGLSEDTIVVFFTDHGQGIPRFKTYPFGLGFRVPLIVRVPKKYQHLLPLKPGATCDEIVSFVDLGPAMLNIAGVQIPETMSGKPVWGPNRVQRSFFYGSLNDVGATENHARCISDGRTMYIRNYMPQLPYAQTQMYCDSAEIMRFIREDYRAGLLSGPSQAFMSPTRPAEALYDLENDPWEITNLAFRPQHQETLRKMRVRNRDTVLDSRDLHFLHAWEIETRAKGRPAAHMRHDRALFPLERILATAELNGHGRAVLNQQFQALTDEEPMCRYWALIGLQAQQPVTEKMIQAAAKLLTDPAPYVRYEAAFICCRYGENPQARKVLIHGIHESHTILVNHAMRKIALLEKKAGLFIDEVREVRETYKQLKDAKKTYEIGTSIDTIELCLADKYPSAIDSY